MRETVLVIWPDGPRHVAAGRVIMWAQDSYDDHPEGDRPTTLSRAMQLLADRGQATFAKGQ